MDARFTQAGKHFLLLSLLLSPVAYFLGTSIAGLLAQLVWKWEGDHDIPDGPMWLMLVLGLLGISLVNHMIFRRLSRRLVEQALQPGAAARGARGDH